MFVQKQYQHPVLNVWILSFALMCLKVFWPQLVLMWWKVLLSVLWMVKLNYIFNIHYAFQRNLCISFVFILSISICAVCAFMCMHACTHVFLSSYLFYFTGIEDLMEEMDLEENIAVVAVGGTARVLQHLTNDLTLVRDAIGIYFFSSVT